MRVLLPGNDPNPKILVGEVNFMNILQKYRYNRCAGKSCHNMGTHLLQVIYLNRRGWFCDSCKDGLFSAGLVKVGTGSNEVKVRHDALIITGNINGGEKEDEKN